MRGLRIRILQARYIVNRMSRRLLKDIAEVKAKIKEDQVGLHRIMTERPRRLFPDRKWIRNIRSARLGVVPHLGTVMAQESDMGQDTDMRMGRVMVTDMRRRTHMNMGKIKVLRRRIHVGP